MRCAHCGHDNPPDANYCLACGTELRRCRTCGRPLPGDARYCPACGASVTPAGAPVPEYTPRHLTADVLTSPGAVEGERKQVTRALLRHRALDRARASGSGPRASTTSSTASSSSRSPRCTATRARSTSSSATASWRCSARPIAHEDHARRAVLAALGIRDALVRAQGRARRAQIAVRIGINTGLVVVGKIGDDLRSDYTAVGDTTILAARLQRRPSRARSSSVPRPWSS